MNTPTNEQIRDRHDAYIERGEPDDWGIHDDRGILLDRLGAFELALSVTAQELESITAIAEAQQAEVAALRELLSHAECPNCLYTVNYCLDDLPETLK